VPELDFNSLVEEYLLAQQDEHPIKPRTFHCSELGYCPRKIYYKRFLQKKPDLKALKNFVLGDLIHEKLTQMLEFKYEEIESEGRIVLYLPREDIRFAGKFDDLVRVDNKEYLIEKKSTRSLLYITEPLYHHKIQLMFYMKALGLQEGYLVYIDKKSFDTSCFKLSFDPELFNQVLKKIIRIQKNIDEKRLPRKQPLGEWECNCCPYKEICAKNLNVGDEEWISMTD